MPVVSSIPRLVFAPGPGTHSPGSNGSSQLASAPNGRPSHSSSSSSSSSSSASSSTTLLLDGALSSCATTTTTTTSTTAAIRSAGAGGDERLNSSSNSSSVVGSSLTNGRSIAVAVVGSVQQHNNSTSSPAANGHMTSTSDYKPFTVLPTPTASAGASTPAFLQHQASGGHSKMPPASLIPSPSQPRRGSTTNLPISSTSMLILNDHSTPPAQGYPPTQQQQQHKMRLTKSQSMKFDTRLQQPTTPQQQSNLPTPTTPKRGVLEPSKSLDFLSLSAKMPTKLSTTTSNTTATINRSTLLDGDRSSSCSESTASLGLLSNLNDNITNLMTTSPTTTTVNDDLTEMAINSDGDMDQDDSLDLLGANNNNNLTVIEESPAPSLDSSTITADSKLDSTGSATMLSEEKMNIEEEYLRSVIEDEEMALMSIDSIEINELPPEPVKEKMDVKVPKRKVVAKETKMTKTVASKVDSRLNGPGKSTSLYNNNNNNINNNNKKRPDIVNRPPSRNGRLVNSNKSSQPSSRASTPAFSESEPNSLSSNVSIVLKNVNNKQRNVLQSKTTSSIRTLASQQTGTFKKPAPVNGAPSCYRSIMKTGSTVTPTGTTPSLAMKRSTTYTRALSAQQQQNGPLANRTGSIASSKSNEARKHNTTAAATTGGKSFTRPTTSYLKKTTTAFVTPSRLVSSAQSKRPSSVASNSSTSSATPRSSVPGSLKSSVGSGAKRSPTITLLSSVVSPGSRSGQSSRRSSITSPSIIKPTLAAQVQHYEQLTLDQAKHIQTLQCNLRQSTLAAEAILACFGHLLHEYSPLDTPHLRSELATLHHKCCSLNRDYELTKEVLLQKEIEVAALTQQTVEANRITDKLREEIESVEVERRQAKSQFDQLDGEKRQLEAKLAEAVDEVAKEKEAKSVALARVEHLEKSLKADKKYREFKEKCSNLEKEVESLNVVVEMKMQRIRHLESEKMRIEMELSEYELLKEAHQQLKRENEALTETLKMKARKNAEQSRDLDHLRAELKRETKEKKQMSIRNDQLEYQLNETRELLNEMSSFNLDPDREENSHINHQNDADNPQFTPLESGNLNRYRAFHRSGKNVRRLFSTPAMGEVKEDSLASRHHYAHQTPGFSREQHYLPELVLSSIGGKGNDHLGQKHSSPVASPKLQTESSRRPSH